MTDANVVVPSNKKQFEDRLRAVLAGVEKNLPAATSLVLAGTSMTQPEIMKRLQDALQLFQDVRDAKSTQKQKLGALHEQLAPEHKFYTALERSLQGYFGKGSPVLLEFGFALGVPKARSATTNVQARAKSKLTRALRHTMGSRQKAAITVSGRPSVVTYAPDGTVISGEVPGVGNQTGGSESSPLQTPTGAPVLNPGSSGENGGASAQSTVK